MAEILLFHHVCGLTDGIRAIADDLSAAGHTVHTPDLFDGVTFSEIEEGVAHAEGIGFAALVERGVDAAMSLPESLVYSGISLGVGPAQKLAQTRPGAAGAILIEACIPAANFADGWPDSVPVQIHGLDADPFFAGEGDIDAARSIVAQAEPGLADLFIYPGNRHLFSDPSLPTHDPRAFAELRGHVLAFLNSVDGRANAGDR